MKFMTVSDSRTNYAKTLDQVVDDREEVVITRDKGDVVLVAREEYESLLETLHLLSTPANAAALERSFTQAARADCPITDSMTEDDLLWTDEEWA